jgi:hypothetical protein
MAKANKLKRTTAVLTFQINQAVGLPKKPKVNIPYASSVGDNTEDLFGHDLRGK